MSTKPDRLETARFAPLAWANLCAQLSEQLALAAAPLVAVVVLGAGPVETGWLQTAQTLPFLLLAIPAGVLVDRAARKRLMIRAECLRTVCLGSLIFMLAAGQTSLALLALLGFISAAGTVCFNVATPAIVPALVPRTHLAEANRWLELVRSAAYLGGPAIGGAIIGWMNAIPAYGLALVLSLMAMSWLASLREDAPHGRARHRLWSEVREGAGFVMAHPLLRPILLTAVLFNLGWFVLQAVYVAYAIQSLGMNAAMVGSTLALYGGGMLAGAFFAPLLARRVSFGILITLGPLGGLCAALLMAATMVVPSGLLSGFSLFLFGAGPVLWTIATTTLRQAVTPPVMLGRVSALLMTATYGARPLGAVAGAVVTLHWGVEVCLLVALSGFAGQFALICLSPVPRLSKLPEAA